jgi:cyanophycinase-like exopeptidase
MCLARGQLIEIYHVNGAPSIASAYLCHLPAVWLAGSDQLNVMTLISETTLMHARYTTQRT